MDRITTGRLDGDSLWLYQPSGIDAATFERLHSVLSDVSSLVNAESVAISQVAAGIAAGTPRELSYRHERGLRFKLEVGVRNSWLRTVPISPDNDHLSWLAFVHLWATSFDELAFQFGTVQSGAPAAKIDPGHYREPSQLLLYGSALSDRIGRDHLCATPALATGELPGGSVIVLVDRKPTEPVRRHLSGEAVPDASTPVSIPQQPPPEDLPNDVVGMLAYLGDWVPRRIGKFELEYLPTDATVSRLTSLLRDDRPRVRTEAAWGLGIVVGDEAKHRELPPGELVDHDVIEARSDAAAELCGLLRADDDPAVRRAAAAALEEFPTDPPLEALAAAIADDSDSGVRTAAAESFGLGMQLKPRGRIDRLVNVLGPAFENDPAPAVRKAAINSLVPAGGPQGFEYGVQALDDSDEGVRRMARMMLMARLRGAQGERATRLAPVIETHATRLAAALQEDVATLEDIANTHENPGLREAVQTVYEVARSDSAE